MMAVSSGDTRTGTCGAAFTAEAASAAGAASTASDDAGVDSASSAFASSLDSVEAAAMPAGRSASNSFFAIAIWRRFNEVDDFLNSLRDRSLGHV